MTISALVVTLDPDRMEHTLMELRRDPRLELGERHANRVPVVAETETCRAGRELFEQLRDTAGVAFVDVVLVDMTEELAV